MSTDEKIAAAAEAALPLTREALFGLKPRTDKVNVADGTVTVRGFESGEGAAFGKLQANPAAATAFLLRTTVLAPDGQRMFGDDVTDAMLAKLPSEVTESLAGAVIAMSFPQTARKP